MSLKIVGIGNAITDILCKITDDFINKLSLNKGSMSLIDENFLANFSSINIDKLCSGGSAGNTIATLAQLGNEVAFIGNVANDFAGNNFINDIEKYGAKYIGSIDKKPSAKTASSFILISPDAQRTMCTFLGCASDISAINFSENLLIDANILYIEGYLWDAPATIESIKKAIIIAKKLNNKIAFSLSDSFCVKRHRSDFIALLKQDVDIIFANENEILELLQIDNFNHKLILDFFSKINPNLIIAITRSEKGCVIINNGQMQEISTKIINNVLDTTGAGDNFASGFLHNFARNKNLKECAEYGNFLAGEIIQKIGARFNDNEINHIKNQS